MTNPTVLKPPKYKPVIDTFATKVKMQDAIEFYEEFCPTCRGSLISLKEEGHKRKFCPNCTPSSKQRAFQKLNEKVLQTLQSWDRQLQYDPQERVMKEVNPEARKPKLLK
jgi:ribosomal protein S27AE